jgi:SagB-type dehydrogenase family enzyme
VIVLTAVFWRSRFKYGARAYRFALIEAGHVAQSLLLGAAALGLRTLPVGGFYDRSVDALIGIDGVHEAALYLLPVGASPE